MSMHSARTGLIIMLFFAMALLIAMTVQMKMSIFVEDVS